LPVSRAELGWSLRGFEELSAGGELRSPDGQECPSPHSRPSQAGLTVFLD